MAKRRVYSINLHPYDLREKKLYMNWLLKQVCWRKLPQEIRDRDYTELLSFLMEKEVQYDGLRCLFDTALYSNGQQLRKIYNNEVSRHAIDENFASVLDVFVYYIVWSTMSELCGYSPKQYNRNAISTKHQKMWHPEAFLFEIFMNMGLDYFFDDQFDPYQVSAIVDMWQHKEYTREGWGSPFPLDHFESAYYHIDIYDMRELSFGVQYDLYLSENKDRYWNALDSKENFYDVFKFKEQRPQYHPALEDALKIKYWNHFGTNIQLKSW